MAGNNGMGPSFAMMIILGILVLLIIMVAGGR